MVVVSDRKVLLSCSSMARDTGVRGSGWRVLVMQSLQTSESTEAITSDPAALLLLRVVHLPVRSPSVLLGGKERHTCGPGTGEQS